MNGFLKNAGIALLPLFLLMPLSAQDSGITRQQADQILEELRQIRQLLERQQQPKQPPSPPAPTRAVIDLTSANMMGSKTAPITMVEFTDYQCPFCQRFHVATFAELKKTYIDTGKVRFYSRDLPLDSIHPNAMRAAQAGRCAGDQGQFWKMRDLMAGSPDKLEMNSLVDTAASLKMDTAAFKTCVESGKYKDAVQTDVLEALKFGIGGTPSFVVGKSTATGVDGEVVEGALPIGEFARIFTKLDAAK